MKKNKHQLENDFAKDRICNIFDRADSLDNLEIMEDANFLLSKLIENMELQLKYQKANENRNRTY